MACKRTLLAMVVSAVLAHGASAQQRPDKVTIGYLNLVNAQLVSKALGLHEKEMGVPIEWVKFGSGGDVNRAVAANQLSFGGVGNPPATIGSEPNGPSIVFGLSPNLIDKAPLMSRPIANVAMTRVNSGALTIGRISTRSIAMPPTAPSSTTATSTTG